METGHMLSHFTPGTLVITPGDREDVVLAAVSLVGQHARGLCGLVLSSDLRPNETVMQVLHDSDLPAIASPLDSYTIASRIHSMTIKTLPGDTEKIERIQALTEKHINLERLLEKL
jgi:BioD-like phosphotransacetylase family protein